MVDPIATYESQISPSQEFQVLETSTLPHNHDHELLD